MSSIAGFFHPDQIFTADNEKAAADINKMSAALSRRGPDGSHVHSFSRGRLVHGALSCGHIHPDIPTEPQPAAKRLGNSNYILLYDGFISNLPELRGALNAARVLTDGLTQEELLLCEYG